LETSPILPFYVFRGEIIAVINSELIAQNEESSSLQKNIDTEKYSKHDGHDY
jgi:hypothetical protein